VNEVDSVLREREPTYLALANLIVDASRGVEEVAEVIAAKFVAA
jgi:hypothetical protein